jgi:hypothetical protein
MTTQQRVANDDAISVGGDTFHIATTHFDVSQRNQTTTEDDDYGTFFLFHEKLRDNFACKLGVGSGKA